MATSFLQSCGRAADNKYSMLMNIVLTGALFFAGMAKAEQSIEEVREPKVPEFSENSKDFSESKPTDSAPIETNKQHEAETIAASNEATTKTSSLFEDDGSGADETAELTSEADKAPELTSGAEKEPELTSEADKEPELTSEANKAEPVSQAKKLFARAKCEALPQRSSTELWAVAECFKEQNDYTQAIASLQELIRKDPQDLEATFILAWLVWEEGRRIGGRRETTNTKRAVAELMKARNNNPTHWLLDVEIGDFYFLRMNAPDLAYSEYLKARKHAKGDFSRSVPKASLGRKVSIENRIARTTSIIGRKGEAVEASCNALYMDPDDPEAAKRIRDLSGSCERKGVENPLLRVPAQAEPTDEYLEE